MFLLSDCTASDLTVRDMQAELIHRASELVANDLGALGVVYPVLLLDDSAAGADDMDMALALTDMGPLNRMAAHFSHDAGMCCVLSGAPLLMCDCVGHVLNTGSLLLSLLILYHVCVCVCECEFECVRVCVFS